MSREAAIRRAEAYFDSGGFEADLARRVAIPTESQNPDRAGELKRYLDAEIVPALEALGFRCRLLTHEKARGPFLAAERIEAAHGHPPQQPVLRVHALARRRAPAAHPVGVREEDQAVKLLQAPVKPDSC